MRRLLCLLLLPLMSLFCLYGCGEDKTSKDLQVLYESIVDSNVVDKTNKFFSDKSNPNSLAISYSVEVQAAIDNVSPTNDIQKRYKAIGIQQDVLDCIYNYYENNHIEFYKVMSSGDYSNSDMNDLYVRLENLKNVIDNFKKSYNTFVDATQNGVSDVMEFNLTNYSFELNKVIDASFDFIYKFIEMYQKYCISDFNAKTATNLQIRVDKSYVDLAYVVYLQNIKAFDYSVGSKGICDLSTVINSSSEYSILDDLGNIKALSSIVQSNLNIEDSNYNEVNDLINNYLYAQEVFDQRFSNYKSIYNEQDIYKITQFKFDLVNGVDYDSYMGSLSSSEKSSIEMLNSFVDNTYQKLVDKLSLIVE